MLPSTNTARFYHPLNTFEVHIIHSLNIVDNSIGSVMVYTNSSKGKWQEVQTLSPGGGSSQSNFGVAVAAQGNFIVGGAYNYGASAPRMM